MIKSIYHKKVFHLHDTTERKDAVLRQILLRAMNTLPPKQPFTMNTIILMFGFGMVAHLAVSLIEENVFLRKTFRKIEAVPTHVSIK